MGVCVCACVRVCVGQQRAGREEGGGLVVRGEEERERGRERGGGGQGNDW